jgi:two-component system cell cycle response regulator
MEHATEMPTVMVVDDDPATVLILAHHLQHEGFTTVKASSGTECLSIVQKRNIDLILLDLVMPEMDGFAVCLALKDNSKTAEIPIIMITARDDLEARNEAKRLGVNDFLAKPIFRRQLINHIRARLNMDVTGRLTEATLNKSRQEADGEKKPTAKSL